MTQKFLEKLVVEYKREFLPRHCEELGFFNRVRFPTFEQVVAKAGEATDRDGLIFSHQRRLGRVLLESQRDELLDNIEYLRACNSFDELYDAIGRHLLYGVGPLYCYDTALRLGAWMGLFPRIVYLHCGSLAGFKALGYMASDGTVLVDDLPKPLHDLPPDQIESFLCIYSGVIAGAGKLNAARRARI